MGRILEPPRVIRFDFRPENAKHLAEQAEHRARWRYRWMAAGRCLRFLAVMIGLVCLTCALLWLAWELVAPFHLPPEVAP